MRKKPQPILTDADIRRAMLLLTLLSVVISVGCSAVVVFVRGGLDLTAGVSLQRF